MAASIITDTGIIKTTDLISKRIMNLWQMPIFIIISVGFLVTQYLLLRFIKKTSSQVRGNKHSELNILWKIVFTAQVGLTAIMLIVLYQVLDLHRYNITLISVSTILAYQLAITMSGILAQQFFSWYSTRRNLLVLIYGLASSVIALSSIISMAYIVIGLLGRPMEVGPHYAYGIYAYAPNTIMYNLNTAYTVTVILSFILMWLGTSLVLRSYSFRLGKRFYWVIISIPLIYFLIQFLPFSVSALSFIISSNPVSLGLVFTLIFTFSKAIGGLMFAIAFYIAARSVTPQSIVRDYMFIASFGIVLFFLSGQTTATDASYPPFGLISIIATGLNSYFLFIGLYSSAVSVSADISLRKSIRRTVEDQTKFLEKIGGAEMESNMQKIQNRVMNSVKEQNIEMEEESGVESSLTEQEIKSYMEEVVREVKERKT
jgi:hypothetical protein